jgi:4'-phosphopantetheinyl transferase
MKHIVQIVEETALSPAQEHAWLRELPASRSTELMGWPQAPARHRSLLGSRLLREGLKHFGFPAASLASLRYSRRGKPTLDLPIDFSLSHCAGRILCALSTFGPVGADVEPIGALTAAEFKHYLAADERAWAGDDPQRFCALWTRKEAVIKAADSRGLAALRDVRIDHDQAVYAGTRWHTAPIPVGRGFSAHVAQAGPFLQAPESRRFTIEELASG